METKYIRIGVALLISFIQLILVFFFTTPGIMILRIVGFLSVFLSVFFLVMSFVTLMQKGGVSKGDFFLESTTLVHSDVYAIIRHPQYLSIPLLNLSLVLIAQHWLVLLIGIPSIALMVYELVDADKEGIEKFDEEYRRYMNSVPHCNIFVGLYRSFFS
jgi:protein-S-isoprenylcysteine O-methyltransferase Ste14